MNVAVNLNPGHGSAGRKPTRAQLDTLSGHDDPGKFGRMFPGLPGLHVDNAALLDLANAMVDPDNVSDDNPNIPAGFTYFGQFVDHDITLDLTSLGDKMNDPQATQNFRSPALDLDSVYGRGPDASPHLYARDPSTGRATPRLLIGTCSDVTDVSGGPFRNDLPRSPEGRALIGDHRNDENLLVSQTHLAMLKFHNAIVDMREAQGESEETLFENARQLATWHYQWIVLHDYLGRLTEPGTVDRILHDGRKFYRFKKTPYMPVEFSGGAYRLGHSMVRNRYSHNRLFDPTGFDLLFLFTGLSGRIMGDLAAQNPGAFDTLPENWIIDWRRFYEVDNSGLTQMARKLDPFLASELFNLPEGHGDQILKNLAARNLIRGVQLGLPSGQMIADAMGIANPLTSAEIASGPDGQVAQNHGLHQQTPLWYYVLKEAQVRHNGERLGTVGSTIIAETLVGLVHGDHQSYLWQRGVNWRPTLPSQVSGEFTMADLIRFVGDINPIG
ncbi:peroxidase family protein [Palleronia caenipelagi]|uniref:Heme peroxidase n=1 Tax=Palleronia caenipelagi TaxID=2489174 RepID=A0A547PN25_9RHOB|nr:heme peroxidase family protein [Palleronia caenipelagi]TRD15505.1 heme peroxidase [Palleronia caenipelagi]